VKQQIEKLAALETYYLNAPRDAIAWKETCDIKTDGFEAIKTSTKIFQLNSGLKQTLVV